MFGLSDKVVLVTGGNRGIGKAVVNILIELGAKVAYVSKTGERNNKALSIKADVTNSEQMKTVIEEIESKLGPIYGVVANAGINKDSFFHKMTDEMWEDVINVNLNGVYNTIKHVVPNMYKRKEGSIVLVSSIVGESGNLGQVNYAASKAALLGLTKSLAKEGAAKGVRVNAVSPGFTNTDMTKGIPDKVKLKIMSSIPLQRFAEPEEIAWSILFLLSPKLSSYITGEVIRINGGQLM